jgi:hypothetical protein
VLFFVQLKEADEVHRRMKHGVYINMASMFAVQQQRNTLAAERVALEEQLQTMTDQTSTHRTKLFRLEEAEFWRRSRLRSRAVQTDPEVMDGRGMQTDKSYLASLRAVEALSGVSSASKPKAASARVSSMPVAEPVLPKTPKSPTSSVPSAASVSESTRSSPPASSEPSISIVPPISVEQAPAVVSIASKSATRPRSRPSSGAAAGREPNRTVSPSSKSATRGNKSLASSCDVTRTVNAASDTTSPSFTGQPASGQKSVAGATSGAAARATSSRKSAAQNAAARAALADMLRVHLGDDDEFDLAGNKRPSTAAQRLYPVRTWTPAFGDDGLHQDPSSLGMDWGRSAVPIRVEPVNVLKNDPASAQHLLAKLQEAQVEQQVAAASAAAMGGRPTRAGSQLGTAPMRPVAVDAAESSRWAVPVGHATVTPGPGTPADFRTLASGGRASTGTLGLMPTEPTTRPAMSARRPATGGAVPAFVKRLIKDESARR